MIRINRDDIPQIAQEFDSFLSDYLKDGRSNKKRSLLDYWIASANRSGDAESSRYADMLTFYKNKRNAIAAINSLYDLRHINARFYNIFRNDIADWQNASMDDKKNKAFGMFSKKMSDLYSDFISYSGNKLNFKQAEVLNPGNWLARRLNVRTCPYCNRHYTFTVEKKGKRNSIRPQFDHFLPKSIYPLTALCLYNLIPSCPDCNKVKLEKPLKIHPFEDSFDDNGLMFEANFLDFSVKIKNGDSHPNVQHLALNELYAQHSDLAEDLYKKAIAYSSDYYKTLIDSFSGLGMTETDLDKLIWGNSFSIDDHLSRPFSKFTRDICLQLGIKR